MKEILIKIENLKKWIGLGIIVTTNNSDSELVELINDLHRKVKNLDLHIVSNNEADLDCDYDITAKVPFKSKKRYKMKVISEVAVCDCAIPIPDSDNECCTICGKLLYDE